MGLEKYCKAIVSLQFRKDSPDQPAKYSDSYFVPRGVTVPRLAVFQSPRTTVSKSGSEEEQDIYPAAQTYRVREIANPTFETGDDHLQR